MQHTVRYFVSENRAYRSELDLFRTERITARDCATVEARRGAALLYAVEDALGLFHLGTDAQEALAIFVRERACRLRAIQVAK